MADPGEPSRWSAKHDRGGLAIEARAISKVYRGWLGSGDRQALSDLNLSLPRGTAFGLIGANGAGKTTFVKTLLGVVTPSGGELRVLGGEPAEVTVRARIGYVPERLALPPAWTGRAYLHSVARLKRVRDARADVTRQLDRVGLGSEAERRIGQFSKGMRQRLALAAALLGAPELLILDEPTDGVDPLGRAEIRQLLTEERARGATLFLNSHLLSETERMCDAIGILSRGSLVRQGSVRELCGAPGVWRVRFELGSDAALEPSSFQSCPDGSYRVRARDAAALDRELGLARSSGALLIELRPDAKELEEVLAEVMSA